MTQIILNEEQTQIIDKAQGPVSVRDARGRVVGHLEPADVLAEAKRRLASSQSRVSGQEVFAHLRALEEEWQRTGGFDRDYMHAFLDRLRAGEGS